jgi:hypothetical protein
MYDYKLRLLAFITTSYLVDVRFFDKALAI